MEQKASLTRCWSERVAATLPSKDMWQNALWGRLQWRKTVNFLNCITRCCSPPLAPDSEKRKGQELFWIPVSSLQQVHWSLALCKFRLSWCLCFEASVLLSCCPLTPEELIFIDSTRCHIAYRFWSTVRSLGVVFAGFQCCWSGDAL